VSELKVADLIADDKNANKGTDRGRKMVKQSLGDYGAGRSILIDKHGKVIAGNKTVESCGSVGISDVIVVQTDGTQLVAVQRTDLDMADPKARELAIADNRSSELGLEWDTANLKMLEPDVDLKKFWDDEELEALGVSTSGSEPDPKDDETPEAPVDAVSILGDLWSLGQHRLMCADCTDPNNLSILTDGQAIQMVFTDPPYGVEVVNSKGMVSTGLAPGPGLRGKVGGDKAFGKVDNIHNGMKAKPIIEANVYAPIIGDDSTDTAIKAFNTCAELNPTPTMIFWGGNYYASALPDSSCWIVWDKDNGESFFADAELAWTNLKTAVRIFKHQWNGLIKASERGEKRCHPTQKPVALAVWCFEKYGDEGDNVLDLFGGSGSALIACEKTNRSCFMAELAPHYVDVIIERWQKFTGKEATLDGQTFAQVKASRRGSN
jgi:16S rRNA G966 N2-methylase RsmD